MEQLKPNPAFVKNDADKQMLAWVLQAIRSIEYGYVQITIQNGQVVQIDKTEKMRLKEEKMKIRGGDGC
jgi:hypothetical protein